MRCVTIAFSGCFASSFACPAAVPSAYGLRIFASVLSGSATSRRCRARELHRQRLAPEPLAVTQRALGALHVLRDAPLHHRALGVRERLQHVASRARERAHVAGLFLSLERAPRLGRRVAGVHRDRRLFVGEEHPVALLLRQIAPRLVDVVAHRHENVAQVLPLPRGRPRGDCALANRERIVGDHRALGHLVHASESVTSRAGAGRRVRRERLRLEMLLLRRIVAGARVQHAQQIRECRDAPY